jgi:hypothetical protein
MQIENRFRPVTARLLAGLIGNKRVADCADETLELAPADESEGPPAISLPDEFAKVIGVEPNSTVEDQLKYVNSRRLEHGPTLAYRLKNAFLADSTTYFNRGYSVARRQTKRAVVLGNIQTLTNAQLCTYPPANIYFGHWLRDALTIEILAEQRKLPGISFQKPVWNNEPDYRRLAQLPGLAVRQCHVENLWVIDDRGLNCAWVRRFQELRSRIRSNLKRCEEEDRGDVAYLVRGKTGDGRQLTNEEEIQSLLYKEGFQILEPEKMRVDDLLARLSNCRMIVSTEGSAINHVHFGLREGGGLLTIQPPERFNAFHRILADFNGIRFGYIVGEAGSLGFSLDPNRLLQTISLMRSVTG